MASLGGVLPLLQEAHGSGALVILIRDFPKSPTVTTPSTDLQHGLGCGIRVKDALLVLDLGKKGSVSVFRTTQGDNSSHQPGPHSDFLPAVSLSDWSHREAKWHGYPETSLARIKSPGSCRNQCSCRQVGKAKGHLAGPGAPLRQVPTSQANTQSILLHVSWHGP